MIFYLDAPCSSSCTGTNQVDSVIYFFLPYLCKRGGGLARLSLASTWHHTMSYAHMIHPQEEEPPFLLNPEPKGTPCSQ